MSQFEKRVQLNKIIESQLPEFLVADFPKAIEFFRQYYLSLEHQGGSVDLVDNLDRYIRVCLLYTSPSPRDRTRSRMPSSA